MRDQAAVGEAGNCLGTMGGLESVRDDLSVAPVHVVPHGGADISPTSRGRFTPIASQAIGRMF
jgi:hypothetical protein